MLQDHRIRVSWKTELCTQLADIFDGRPFVKILQAIEATHKQVLRSRVFIALHMHAGDGNVHTNIPVNSDDYAMLQEAAEAVARVMRLAVSLGGVVSGEHGIGITKLEFLDPEKIEAFRAYKETVDPDGRFNKGKLLPGSDLHNAYTPSFSLIGAESLILEQSDIGRIADMIKNCLRCGKCKPVCMTHVPRANLLYSPRNKILATSLLTEAFLYEEQTRRGISLQHFDEFGDVADHCTVCHKCVNPCPVDIDFGDVSIAMRNYLRRNRKRRPNIGLAASMAFLNATDPTTINALRLGMIRIGYRAQRFAHRCAKAIGLVQKQTRRPPATTGKPPLRQQVIHFINKPMPGNLPKRSSRALLDIEDPRIVPIVRDPARTPGRGSRLLFSRLRFRAALRTGRPRDTGDALRRGRADGAAAGVHLLRLSADGGRRRAQGPRPRHGEPRAVPPRRAHARVPRHQDRDRLVRHVSRSARRLRVRQDLSRLPAARHPRVPDGERREARRRERRALHVSRSVSHAR